MLDNEFNGGDVDTSTGEKNPGNVAGGLKAYVSPTRPLFNSQVSRTTKNPNVSQEVKDSAAQRLNNMGQ